MKKIIIPILMFLIMALGVMAATVVNLDPQAILVNQSYKATQTVIPNFNVTGNSSTWTCKFYSNENGSAGVGTWREIQTDSGVSNNTNTNFSQRQSIKEQSGLDYCWDVFCNSTNDATGAWGAQSNSTQCDITSTASMNYSVDVTSPIVTVNYPTSSGVWYTTNTSVRIGLTVLDSNVDGCVLETNLNTSSNNTGVWSDSFQNSSYTNNTAFNFTGINATNGWFDNGAGAYLWNYLCNDLAGNTAINSVNFTFLVDIVNPTSFIFDTSLWKTDNRLLYNATTATDYTPQVGWNQSNDNNFSRYELIYYASAYGTFNSSTDLWVNITSSSTLASNISTLAADTAYFILVTAFDLAGNKVNMSTIDYKYSTDSTNRALSSGWNLVGNVGNSFNLSDLRSWTGASTVSIWQADHTFISHVSGGINGSVSVGAGEVVLIYVDSTTTFSDLVWNTSAVSEETHNITNQSSSTWNLVMMRDDDDDKYFQDLDVYLNCNPVGEGCASQANNATYVDFFSHYNNSASSGSKYIPFIANWSISNATTLGFGDTVWLYLDGTEKAFIQMNWTAI